ncbi:transporter substrate-binding domain-containing protein [Paraburkholderia terrae]|uniref:Amino acid ABC transporter substrate-binding protein n=1 Tax=Paraburkholderia terrae TaxID=311230 RepID=A0A2I8F4F7_9BURK|nr:transporter substrate-binding domain-containing protein [Paraburkholderia terrae]AUT66757.1 amino acid ABC transporter substrate-binding protein [Paraburkholderia terrae]
MKVRIAYLEEPPFYWTDSNQSVTGSDIELADVILRAIGVTSIEHQPTSFEELLPGVQEGRWDMNVPIFVTAERAKRVAFSTPVWALVDGFLLPSGNPSGLTSYSALAKQIDARLGVVAATVQIDAAKSAGVSEEQIVIFDGQNEALEALLSGKIDAYAATAVGNRALAGAESRFEAVAHEKSGDGKVPVGAFSCSKSNQALLQAVNEQLRKYLGSPDHRARMAKYGITNAEIDSVVAHGN